MAKESKTLVDIRQHVLYAGVTLTGKTTLARHHAQILDKADYDLVVYDPVGTPTMNGDWPEQAKILRSPAEFHKEVDKMAGTPERPVFLFVDESADVFGHSETHAFWIPRKIRHRDVYLRTLVQRPKMLHPSVRTQHAIGYMLRLSKDDAAMLAADFGHGPDVYNLTLDTGDCVMLTSGHEAIERFNVFELVDSRQAPTA